MKTILFFDLETNLKGDEIRDIGCITEDDKIFHENSTPKFLEFIRGYDFVCGHNILKHDLPCLQMVSGRLNIGSSNAIDTLYLSPLLFPNHPYHRLLKNDKLQTEERNNPVNDSKKARDLFHDEVRAFANLPESLKKIYYNLLHRHREFAAFFRYIGYSAPVANQELESLIRFLFESKICQHADVGSFISKSPLPLAYCLSLINISDRYSITPPWVLHTFPDVDPILFLLRNKPCITGCPYCDEALDPIKALKRHFNYESFRSYDGKPLQENAVRAAVNNQSLLAVFPTGGGKSITFQIPALMSGENAKALTVVISPLQSLMKDQVDNLEKNGIVDAVTINGMLDPIERQNAIERVAGTKGDTAIANILYLSPESLRSTTIERLLLGRKIARFVIDEAHCFSSWGQDFRVDYLYIADFIKNLQKQKGLTEKIPVSCFTATAKQKVVEDIRAYFKDHLGLDLEVFRASASRSNLTYQVLRKETEDDKYGEARRLLEEKKCPTIIYVSRTKKAYQIAQRLSDDGFNAKPYHGKMDKEEKIQNQNAFIGGEVDIMVATSAFGMGVDKNNIGMVIHYEISDSLENYVQEAGRAGRKEDISAECYVLFGEEDLDKHFLLLNQTKLDSKEINQIWKAIKELTRTRAKTSNSALEIARKAGWDDSIEAIETRVTTAIAALEDAGYLKRGQNMPKVFADSILSKSAQEAVDRINGSDKFSEGDRAKAIRIIKKLFSSKSKRLSTEEVAESRIDHISDHLGMHREEVIRMVTLLKNENILADNKDLTAFIRKGESSNRSLAVVERYRQLEEFLMETVEEGVGSYHIKELNQQASDRGCKDATPNKLKTLLNFWAIKKWVKRQNLELSKNHIKLALCGTKGELKEKMAKRHFLARFIVEHLYQKITELKEVKVDSEEVLIEFSVLELKAVVERGLSLFLPKVSINDIEDALFYLSRIEAIKIEGGFLVIYNRLSIDRIERNNQIQYKKSDYQKLAQFYQSKVQQIHIVGEYAKKMIEDYGDALRFVDDYFQLNYTSFLNKYFPGSDRQKEIGRTMTPAKFRQIFGALSPAQHKIIHDRDNKQIVVAAGPGSGKTRVLVHKLASLLLMEDVKHEQLLMLTFSRAAATEFKKRLLDLIGNAAHYVEIKTFHSYCFDLLGKVGDLNQVNGIIQTAIEKITNGDIEKSRITKTVLVIDEAQDMDAHEFNLVHALINQNEDLRVLLVGDDDQNIYGFRGADSKYMLQLIQQGAMKYELIENYRSKANIVDFANQWIAQLPNRLKRLPVMAYSSELGQMKIVQYDSKQLIKPLVEDLLRTDLTGSTCILTRTNEEAVQISGLLQHKEYPVRLIQTNQGFPLYNLRELRYFSNLVLHNETDPVIGPEEWSEAKHRLNETFCKSNKLEWCQIIIDDFEKINGTTKYKSDWKTFLMESRWEDFVRIKGETIYVSTIHKAKGKEFDNVFLLLSDFDASSEECKRQFYVAVTRAKNNLFIHYNGQFLSKLVTDNLLYRYNQNIYTAPEYLTAELSHKEVNLGYFEYVQRRIEQTTPGIKLFYKEEGLVNASGELVLKFSSKFKEFIRSHALQGYRVDQADINFVLYWKGEENKGEVQIVLPQVTFKKA